ncbi:hypothetical protein Hanom_Chr04g00361121 [Helianthus anomalus]
MRCFNYLHKNWLNQALSIYNVSILNRSCAGTKFIVVTDLTCQRSTSDIILTSNETLNC